MSNMCLAYFGALLLALHLSSQVVLAQNATADPMDMATSSYSMTPTMNMTDKDNGSGSLHAFTLLLPLAVAASLLLGWH